MSKKVTYDDTRDIAIRVIEKLIKLGRLNDENDHYFDIQDTIQDEINSVLNLDIDDNFEVNFKVNTNKNKMNRKQLISELMKLQSDEFDAKEVMYLTKKELMQKIIECAYYYKNELNVLESEYQSLNL